MSEQLLVRGLPDGTKAQLKLRALGNSRSIESQARQIIVDSLNAPALSLAEMLADPRAEADFHWQPDRLGLALRAVEF
jgi:antitoxin FitA